MNPRELVIGGTRVQAPASDPVVNPYTGETVAEVPQASREQVVLAVEAAARAFPSFAAWPAHRRAALLMAVAEGVAARRGELADSIVAEAGKPVTQALGEVDRAVTTFTVAAEEAKRLGGEVVPADTTPAGEHHLALWRRFPLGPVSAISPFNFPLNLVAHKLAPAFAVGAPVVLKPPVQAPLTSMLLADIMAQAGAPDGAFAVVPCNPAAAEPLITDDRMKVLSFTGSDRVGWQLKAKAGKKRVLLELGGNAAVIVCEGTDLKAAAARIAYGAFAYAGQVCISVQRIFVHTDIYDPFLEAFLAATAALPVGDPRDPRTVVGPMIDDGAARRVLEWVEEARAGGARVALGSTREGNVLAPVVLTDAPSTSKVSCAEVFGPVAVVAPFATFEEAVSKVNDSPYGLQAGVYTRDLNQAIYAFHHLDVGGVLVGDVPTFRLDHTPYGGTKDSGLGREGVRYAMEEITERRLLLVRTTPEV
jgi:acyl-CoA reductase-like NAD-dependent aldehyde dehydrogenase